MDTNQSAGAKSTLRGVVFDLDGVLVDSHAAHRKSWRLFLHTLGRDVTDSELDFILDGRKRTDILRHFLGDCPVGEIEEFGRQKDSIFRQVQIAVLPVPGAVRLVHQLHRSGVALALATSASPGRGRSTLSELGLMSCFQAVVTAEDVPAGKPDPAVYSLASDRLKIPPRDLLAVEDAVSGVRAALAAGLCCLAVAMHRDPTALAAAGAARVISDFEGITFLDLEVILRDGDQLLCRSAGIGSN
ncbi:MAG: HAD family phosphatase [Candidatus Sulfotelmatobacter sp.]